MTKGMEALLAGVDMRPQRKVVELPQGGEFEFFCAPLTVAERGQAMLAAKDDAQRFAVGIIIAKCMDEAGTPMFAPGDAADLRRKIPSKVIDAIFMEIMGSKEEGEEEGEEPEMDIKSRRRRAA